MDCKDELQNDNGDCKQECELIENDCASRSLSDCTSSSICSFNENACQLRDCQNLQSRCTCQANTDCSYNDATLSCNIKDDCTPCTEITDERQCDAAIGRCAWDSEGA